MAQLRQFLHAVMGPRLGQALADGLALALLELGPELDLQLVHVGPGVPDIQVVHGREAAHRLPVLADSGQDDLAALPGRHSVVPCGHFQARREPLDVPFPWSGQRLIEVVDVEHQQPLGRSENAEIRQVRITAGLHGQFGDRCRGQVAGHRQRGPAEVSERRRRHPAPPDRYQLGHPRRVLRREQRQRLGPVGARAEARVALPGHPRPRVLSAGRAVSGCQMRQSLVEVIPRKPARRRLSCLDTHSYPFPRSVPFQVSLACPGRSGARRGRHVIRPRFPASRPRASSGEGEQSVNERRTAQSHPGQDRRSEK